MISNKNLEELKLTEEQLLKYKELEKKEAVLRSCLKKCGVRGAVIEKIISKSDLKKVDVDNTEALEEDIKETWKDFIF